MDHVGRQGPERNPFFVRLDIDEERSLWKSLRDDECLVSGYRLAT